MAKHDKIQSTTNQKELQFSWWKIFIPVIIGLVVVIWMIFKDAQSQNIVDE